MFLQGFVRILCFYGHFTVQYGYTRCLRRTGLDASARDEFHIGIRIVVNTKRGQPFAHIDHSSFAMNHTTWNHFALISAEGFRCLRLQL
jgi:hypothetical protein